MSEPRTRIVFEDHVAIVSLTRPEKHNALDRAMFEGIAGAAAEVGATPGVRAVVLHGEGPSFCSGLDIASILADGPAASSSSTTGVGRATRTSPSAWPPTGSTFPSP